MEVLIFYDRLGNCVWYVIYGMESAKIKRCIDFSPNHCSLQMTNANKINNKYQIAQY